MQLFKINNKNDEVQLSNKKNICIRNYNVSNTLMRVKVVIKHLIL